MSSPPIAKADSSQSRVRVQGDARRWCLVAAVGASLVVASVLAEEVLRNSEERAFRNHFESVANSTISELRRALRGVVTELEVLGELVRTEPHLDRRSFRRLTSGILERTASTLTVEWIPRVPGEDRRAFEEKVRQAGMPSFEFTERVDGELQSAADRGEYFPVHFVEPVAGNEKAIGFDLGSNPARLAALDLARSTGLPVSSERLTLVQESREQAGILLFVPVYAEADSGAEALSDSAGLLGFTLGVLRVGDFVDSVVPGGYRGITNFRISDLQWSEVGDRKLTELCGDDAVLDGSSEVLEATIPFASRSWFVACTPTSSHLATRSNLHAAVLVLGILLALAISLLTARSTSETRRVSRIVDSKTHDLTVANGRVTLLNRVAGVVASAQSRDVALLETLSEVRRFLGWPTGYVHVVVGASSDGSTRAEIGSIDERLSESEPPQVYSSFNRVGDGSLPSRVLRSGRSAWESNPLADSTSDGEREGAETQLSVSSARAVIAVPVMIDGTAEAVLEFVSTDLEEASSETLTTLDAVAAQLGAGLERQRSGAALADNARRLDLAVRAANEGLWDWQIATGETYFSDTFYTMLGYEPGELPMHIDTRAELCHPDDLPAALEELDRHLAGETSSYRSEQRLRRKDGSWQWIHDIGEVVEWDAEGTPTRAIGVHLDIHEQRRTREAAESATLAKSEFLANMSHEIRTPMTAILGFADVLADTGSGLGAADRDRVVQTIRSNAKHLLTIVNDILDMSKIEAGKMSIERLPTNPARIVDQVVSLLSSRATGKGIEIHAEYTTPVPRSIDSDPTRIRQILLNLVGNALKFTEMGSIVIRVSTHPEDQLMQFEVIDSGIGMSSEQVEVLSRFDAFTQADGSTSREFGGTGLGLRISNKLCQLLGGSLRIASVSGEGSTFSATIGTGDLNPVGFYSPDEKDSKGVETVETMEPSPLGGLRLLYAEDGPDNQRLVAHILNRAGAVVEIVENGRLAVDAVLAALADGKPFDVVLMDMQMPVLDGYSATRELRDRGYSGGIIALTAHAMGSDRKKCLACGCDGFATKPIDREALFEAISAAAPGKLQRG